jgi:hypothetical protein
MPRAFGVNLTVSSDEGPEEVRRLEVNRPVTHRGWRFYLMSYDEPGQRYVVLTARRDPARSVVIGGMWMVMAGTAWLCWGSGRPRRSREDERNA